MNDDKLFRGRPEEVLLQVLRSTSCVGLIPRRLVRKTFEFKALVKMWAAEARGTPPV